MDGWERIEQIERIQNNSDEACDSEAQFLIECREWWLVDPDTGRIIWIYAQNDDLDKRFYELERADD